MPMGLKLAITGRPGSGKTTLVKRVVEALRDHVAVGGIYTQELRDARGRRVGFQIVDVQTGGTGLLAHVELDDPEAPQVGKYRVNVRDVERVAVPAIERALEGAQLVVIDEVAPMELTSRAFQDVVARALELEGERALIITFQQRSRHPLVERLRRACEVYEVTPSNRERLLHELRERLRLTLGKPDESEGPA